MEDCRGYDCPKCDASTGFSVHDQAESWLTCDCCGYEGYSENFKIIDYSEKRND